MKTILMKIILIKIIVELFQDRNFRRMILFIFIAILGTFILDGLYLIGFVLYAFSVSVYYFIQTFKNSRK